MNLLKSMVKNRDRRVSVVVFIFAIVWLIYSKDIHAVFSFAGSSDPGPRLFPILAGILLLITSVGKFVTNKQEDTTKFYETNRGWLRVFAIFAMLAAYCWLLPILGYLLTTFLGGALFVILMKEDRKVRWFSPFVFSGILTGIMYLVFGKALSVVLPVGSLWKMF